jgi:protein-S-isoprenylcysteine O-methyltransferase Ste14
MISAAAVALGSVPILWFSRRSLLRPASHGFPRFFAFEAILALVVVNVPHWFVEPFATRQLASWLLLAVSAVFVVWGVVLLHRFGRSRPRTEGAPEFQWENTTNLVTTGIYRYIRHPMYSSLLLLTWGTLLKCVSAATLALAVVATVALAATAKVEEREDVARFGDEYREYMRRSRRFVPFVV